jgi:hypothetical protein
MCKGFIVNTDPHQKPGKHWIVFFYGRSPDGYSVYLRQLMGTFYRSNDTAVCVPSACFNMFLAKTVFSEFTQRHYKYRFGGFQFD